MRPEAHYISHADERSVIEAFIALWGSVQPADVPTGNKHPVLTAMDISPKLLLENQQILINILNIMQACVTEHKNEKAQSLQLTAEK